jgi:hypothetical protein
MLASPQPQHIEAQRADSGSLLRIHCDWLRTFVGLILCAPCFAGGVAADTARLAGHMDRFRHYKLYELSAAEYKPIQSEYLAWIDSRMKTGTGVARMNAELEAAKLLSNGPESVDDMFNKTYAGFLGKIEAKPGRAEDLLVITFGIHTGGSCNFDETIVVYERKPLRRVAQINAERSYTHGYRLRELAYGKDDPSHGRMIGSAWVASNCNSNWNGSLFRIDLSRGRSIENVLDSSVSAFGGDPVKINIEDNTVTFLYTAPAGGLSVLTRAAIARYRVQAGQAIREAPIATSFGGFINEWLGMDDTEAALWSTPEAGVHHHDLAARSKKELLEWEHVAACPGSPPAREISVQWSESKQATVFLMRASSAVELRMLSVSDQRSPLCRQINISSELSSIFAEPPQ